MRDYETLESTWDDIMSIESAKKASQKGQSKKLEPKQIDALKKVKTKHKTVAKTAVEVIKHKKLRKKSTEAQTVTDNEQIWLIVIFLFLSWLGAVILWWVWKENKGKHIETLSHLINVEIPDAIKEYKAARDAETKELLAKVFRGLSRQVGVCESKLKTVRDYAPQYSRIKASENYKKYVAFKEQVI
jgi:hypothetical protein